MTELGRATEHNEVIFLVFERAEVHQGGCSLQQKHNRSEPHQTDKQNIKNETRAQRERTLNHAIGGYCVDEFALPRSDLSVSLGGAVPARVTDDAAKGY